VINHIDFRKRNATSNITKKGLYKKTRFLMREGWQIEYSLKLETTNTGETSFSSTLDNRIRKFSTSIA